MQFFASPLSGKRDSCVYSALLRISQDSETKRDASFAETAVRNGSASRSSPAPTPRNDWSDSTDDLVSFPRVIQTLHAVRSHEAAHWTGRRRVTGPDGVVSLDRTASRVFLVTCLLLFI